MKIFTGLVLLFLSLAVEAQQTMNFNNIRNVPYGDLRTLHCSATSTPPFSCGTNPPVVTLTPEDCGHPVALSNVRNDDGTVSSAGVMAKLPTTAALAANAGGSFKTCKMSFIFGTPSDNFLCIDPNGGSITGAIVNFNFSTPLCVPYFAASRLDVTFDSVSWKAVFTGSANYNAEVPFSTGQMLKHGDVKMFEIAASTNCPQWVTGTAYAAGACVLNALNLYSTVAGGTAGASAPTCTSSTCSDGTVTWVFSSRFTGAVSSTAPCPQWVTGITYAASACVYNNHGLYTTTAGGLAGNLPPTCVTILTGPSTCVDNASAGVTWTFVQYYYGGDIALCSWNGNGLIIGGPDDPTKTSFFANEILNKIPATCLIYEPDLVAGSTVQYVEATLNASDLTCTASITATCPSGIASGVISGNPNGQGGNYIRFISASSPNMGPQNQIKIGNGTMLNGTVVPQEAIVRLVHTAANNAAEPVPCATTEGTCYDLITPVFNGNPQTGSNAVTTFVPGDNASASYRYYYDGIHPVTFTSPTQHVTDVITGHEVLTADKQSTIVGMVKLNGAVGGKNSISDTESARNVGSWFNRSTKKLRCAYVTDQTDANTTPHETSSTIRCPFLSIGVPATAQNQGAQFPGLEYGYDGAASNATASDGCQSAAAFVTGATLGGAEAGAGAFINNAATNGAYFNVGFTGMKQTLAEGAWSITLLNEAITGGTCTFRAAGSSLFAYPMQ